MVDLTNALDLHVDAALEDVGEAAKTLATGEGSVIEASCKTCYYSRGSGRHAGRGLCDVASGLGGSCAITIRTPLESARKDQRTIVRLPLWAVILCHIILTIAQVHASRGGAGGNQWKSRVAQRPKQTDVRINVAKDQRRFEIFTIRVSGALTKVLAYPRTRFSVSGNPCAASRTASLGPLSRPLAGARCWRPPR
jgi:hypothetical protein